MGRGSQQYPKPNPEVVNVEVIAEVCPLNGFVIKLIIHIPTGSSALDISYTTAPLYRIQ
jgi:hypothetical protein